MTKTFALSVFQSEFSVKKALTIIVVGRPGAASSKNFTEAADRCSMRTSRSSLTTICQLPHLEHMICIQLNENDRVYLAENVFFNWKEIIEKYDNPDKKSKVKSTKTNESSKAVLQKSKKRDYIEIAIVYAAIILMLWLIGLWL